MGQVGTPATCLVKGTDSETGLSLVLPPAGQLLEHLTGDEVTGQLQVAEVGGEPVHYHHHCYHDHHEDTAQ